MLVDVPEDAVAMTEETFGPTITVRRVANLTRACQLANATGTGSGRRLLRQRRRAERARRMRTGMTSVNSVIAFAMVPALPFGGVGESGFGRIHGADGLREFTRAKAITRQRMQPPVNLTSFGRTDKDMSRTVKLVTGCCTGGCTGRRRRQGGRASFPLGKCF